MRRIISICFGLLMCVAIVAIGQTVHATVKFQVTGTSTPSQTPTTTVTTTASPTTTLVPLPAFTLIFPAATMTNTPTISPKPLPATDTPQPKNGAAIFPLSPRLQLLAIFIVLLWLFLAGFVIVYIRQFR
jgi:hypothetical protein